MFYSEGFILHHNNFVIKLGKSICLHKNPLLIEFSKKPSIQKVLTHRIPMNVTIENPENNCKQW